MELNFVTFFISYKISSYPKTLIMRQRLQKSLNKEMIFEIIITLIALGPYLTIAVIVYLVYKLLYLKICARNRVINKMSDLINDLKSETKTEATPPNEETEDKRAFLEQAIELGKGRYLPAAWRDIQKLDKASSEQIDKLYANFLTREMNHKSATVGKVIGEHVILC